MVKLTWAVGQEAQLGNDALAGFLTQIVGALTVAFTTEAGPANELFLFLSNVVGAGGLPADCVDDALHFLCAGTVVSTASRSSLARKAGPADQSPFLFGHVLGSLGHTPQGINHTLETFIVQIIGSALVGKTCSAYQSLFLVGEVIRSGWQSTDGVDNTLEFFVADVIGATASWSSVATETGLANQALLYVGHTFGSKRQPSQVFLDAPQRGLIQVVFTGKSLITAPTVARASTSGKTSPAKQPFFFVAKIVRAHGQATDGVGYALQVFIAQVAGPSPLGCPRCSGFLGPPCPPKHC